MGRLPPIPEVQPGRASHWDFDKSLKRGHVCVVALVRRPLGQGTWRLDRIAKVERADRGREITVVESGIPVTLNRPDAWDGERHWFTYALATVPGDIRAREMWDRWDAEGRPSWRWPKQIKAAIWEYVVTERREAAA